MGHRGPEPRGVRAGDNKGGVWGQRSGTPRQSPFPGSVGCCDLWAEKPRREEEGALGRLFPAGFQLLKSPLVAAPCPWAQGLPVLYTRCWGGPGELPCHSTGGLGSGTPHSEAAWPPTCCPLRELASCQARDDPRWGNQVMGRMACCEALIVQKTRVAPAQVTSRSRRSRCRCARLGAAAPTSAVSSRHLAGLGDGVASPQPPAPRRSSQPRVSPGLSRAARAPVLLGWSLQASVPPVTAQEQGTNPWTFEVPAGTSPALPAASLPRLFLPTCTRAPSHLVTLV